MVLGCPSVIVSNHQAMVTRPGTYNVRQNTDLLQISCCSISIKDV